MPSLNQRQAVHRPHGILPSSMEIYIGKSTTGHYQTEDIDKRVIKKRRDVI